MLTSPDDWIKDRRTGKSYLVLSRGTRNFNHYQLQGLCYNHRARLPQPQDQMEDTFVSNLARGPYMLGMYDTRDRYASTRWVWEWQLREFTNVTWYNWRDGGSYYSPRSDRRCALMGRPAYNGWIDFPCDGRTNPYNYRITNITHICERSEGMFT